MRPRIWLAAGLLALSLAPLGLTGCGGGSTPPPATEGSATIGAAGGYVTGPDGVKLGIPAGSVESDTTFRIGRDGSGAPPLPAGIELASAVYAITPHKETFAEGASVELPVTPSMAAGRPTFLIKASPGGHWSVVGSGDAGSKSLRAGIESLSYLAVGVCQDNLSPGSLFAQACPGAHRLGLELLINGTTPVPVSQDLTYGSPVPVILVTTPETLTFRMTWTRPPGTNRVDALDTGSGFSGNALQRNGGFTFSTTAPRWLDVNENTFSRVFTVDVDPARISGASAPNGVVRRIFAQARYAVTGPGNVGSADWVFDAWVPIRVRSLAPVPVITGQPADVGVVQGQTAGFTVTASISPAAGLGYQWFRRAGVNASFVAISGATAAHLSLAPAQLSDNGAQFQVQVCAGASHCVASNVATLNVSAITTAPTFSAQPLDQMVVAGQTASLNAVATGQPLPQIRWQQAPASGGAFSDITGVTACPTTHPTSGAANVAASCTVGPLVVGDNGKRYRAIATNAAAPAGITSSVATIAVSHAAVAPAITSPPVPQTTTVGGSATFRVAATGTAMLSYAWRLGNGNMPSVSSPFAFTAPNGICRGVVTYSDGGASATFSDLEAPCDGLLAVVAVSNSVNPPATSGGALLTVNPVSQTLTLLAGAIGGTGSLDGPVAQARVGLNPDNGIAVDAAGNMYFSEAVSGKVRKISTAGVVSTIAGATTPLRRPAGVAVDSAGNVYVAEYAGDRILRITPGGVQSVWAGGVQGDQDGVGSAAQFQTPQGLVIDAAGNLYVSEATYSRNRKIRRISPAQEVTTFHDFGSTSAPTALAVDGGGNVYAAGAGLVLRITPAGAASLLAGSATEDGDVNGSGGAARFSGINGVALGTNGHLYVTDANNRQIRRITSAGVVTTVSGGSGSLLYDYPGAIASAPGGELVVGNVATLIRLSASFTATTLVGMAPPPGFAGSLVLDNAGNAYMTANNSIQRITPAGATSTFATVPGATGLRALAVDGTGHLVAADSFRVWRVGSTGTVTPLAGGASGYIDATGAAAGFGQIGGLAVDASGHVFVSERLSHTIRRITTAGVVSTYAGGIDLGGANDGTLSSARFNTPWGLAFDAAANLWVADTGNGTIRRISTAGVVSTVAGTPNMPGSSDGTGAAASFRSLQHLATEPGGALLISDGSTLRRLTPAGVVTTVLGAPGEFGVRLGASPRLNNVTGLAVRPNRQVVLGSEAAVLQALVP